MSTDHQLCKHRAVSSRCWNLSDASLTHTTVKSNRFFFKSHLIKIVKNAKYVNMAVSRGINGYSTVSILRYQVRSPRITEALDSFDYEIHNSIQITFHLAHKWSKCVVSEFSEIMLHKWYFCKLYMIKRKRDNGISIADKAGILIPLSYS